jgi:polysaccharide deacetylase 2 family uncharacterized protein YibQ
MRKRLLPKGFSHWPVYTLAAWVLCGLAVSATLLLDHRNWMRGERSYVFTGSREKKAPAERPRAAPPDVKATPEKAIPEKAPEPEVSAVPKAIAPVKGPPAVKPSSPAGKVALVVDDMGNSLEALDDLLGLGESVTVAILPYSPYALETARKAHEKGLEVLLHLPLESLNGSGSETGTEGLIRSGMGEEEVRALMAEELDRIPHVRGVNNHMGSKVTADTAMMRTILEPLRERGLFFLDSRTSGKSVAYDVAVSMGIPTTSRQVFLDADGDTGRIRERLLELFRIAQRDGRAVGICHPFQETLRTLKENFGLLGNYRLEAVFASEIARR